MNGTFYEQLGGVAGLFEQWGACERTVMACALARRVPWPGLRLLQRAVEAALEHHAPDERLERDANDEALLASLLLASSDDEDDDGGERLRQLLSLLPLLRTDNERAKDVYVSSAPALVQKYVDTPRRSSTAPELCRQLLSYLLVHPALTQHDQRSLTQWLRYLENYISGNRNTDCLWQQRVDPPATILPDNNIWAANNTFRRTIGKNVEFRGVIDTVEHSYTADLSQESFSKNGRDVDISLEGEKLNFDAAISQPKSQRSNSLTPPSSNFMQMSSSAENLSDEPFVQKPRSFSLSSEHSLGHMRPIMYGTTGSETRLDDLRSNNFTEHPGMSTVAQWLKSLRLHKYVWLFTNITYDQMMAMDEEYLGKLGVTKGARHKLLLSIRKLHERPGILAGIEADVARGQARALLRLRPLLLAPMPPASSLPAAVVRVLELAATAGAGEAGDAEPLSLHCWLVERALHLPAFRAPELQHALRRLRHRLPPRQFFLHVGDMPPHHKPKPRWRAGPGGAPWVRSGRRESERVASEATREDYSSLDALCLQMTEQAIN